MDTQLIDRIKAFVAAQTSTKVNRLTLETKLYHDLGIAGDDGWVLIEEFGRQFDVDVSTFQAKRHFGSEGISCPLLSLLFPKLFGEIAHPFPDITPISIRDLAEAAESKRWLK